MKVPKMWLRMPSTGATPITGHQLMKLKPTLFYNIFAFSYGQKEINKQSIQRKRAAFDVKKIHLKDALTQDRTQNLIPAGSNRQRILTLSIGDLAIGLKRGELDPVEVLQAYQVCNIDDYFDDMKCINDNEK